MIYVKERDGVITEVIVGNNLRLDDTYINVTNDPLAVLVQSKEKKKLTMVDGRLVRR